MKNSHLSIKTSFMLSAAVLAVFGGGNAYADDAAPPSDASAHATATSDTNPADIIVTAQRRSQSVQNVPMTLQALSGTSLSQLNATTFDDLLKYTPNVTYGSNGPGAGAIFMRGLSAGFVGNQSSATIATFPNVALYLDDQSMQFPARNADVYLVDMERVEVLEGPQGTLFGGGAEAGAVRYITNKPKLNNWEAKFEGSFGGTADGGAANSSFNATFNIPVIADKLAVRAVIYDERQGGYISNVRSTFTRNNNDGGVSYFGLKPTAGLCPNGLPAGANTGLCARPATQQANGGQYNNYAIAGNNINPVTYQGGRIAAQWDINPDWGLLVSESFQDLDAEGSSAQEPLGLDFQKLGKLQTTIFTPSYNKDRYWNTAWAINGKLGDFKAIYTGAYMTRHIETQQDYTNYSRTAAGMYYQCTGGTTGWGTNTPYCYSPQGYWHDNVRNTHMSHELRITTPEHARIRAIAGAYYEQFKIYDVMNFNYKTIPTCNAALLAQGITCSGNVQPVPGTTINLPGIKPDNTAFGEDTQRGYDQTALFGSVDFDILPNLTITGGTRYYNYKEYEVGSQYETYAGNCVNVTICAIAGSGNANIDSHNDHITYHGFKSRGVITWKPKEHTLVYGLFSQGFRPGGFNRATKLILPGVDGTGPQYNRPNGYAPDNLTNWEVGLKTDLFDRRVQANLSGYYMIWENTQIGFYNPAAGFGNTSFVTNGPNYHIKGGVATPALNPFGAVGGVTPFSPHFQGDIRVRYEGEMKAGKWFMQAGLSYTGSEYNQPSTYPSGAGVTVPGTTQLRYLQPGYALLDASIGMTHDNWTVTVFGKNLTDSNASTFTSSAQYIEAQVPVRPLTYGVKVSAAF